MAGEQTNLVIFDQGLSFGALRALSLARPLRLAPGWSVWNGTGFIPPGGARPDGHGTMVALNAISLAPDTWVWDLPFLPERIVNVVKFASDAAAALLWVDTDIQIRLAPLFPGPWVFCHAWGVYDRRLEWPRDAYTANPLNPLNLFVRWMDDGGRDQVFGAGNGGQFQPHPFCGPGDIGPGQSILGANSTLSVLTTGAVRADGMWIGYSSQGLGQEVFGGGECERVEKPDLCAPSHFVEIQEQRLAFLRHLRRLRHRRGRGGGAAERRLSAGGRRSRRTARYAAAIGAQAAPDAGRLGVRHPLRSRHLGSGRRPGAGWRRIPRACAGRGCAGDAGLDVGASGCASSLLAAAVPTIEELAARRAV